MHSLGPFFVALIACIYILFQFNIWPGTLPDSASYFATIGTSQCLSVKFPARGLTCVYNSYPDGLRVVFGYPEVWLISALHALTGLSLGNSFRLVWAAIILAAAMWSRRFFGLFTNFSWLAWGATVVYTVAPIVADQSGYGTLQLGFALVPAYILLDISVLEALDRSRVRACALGLASILTRMFALFTDGYSFTLAVVASGVIYVWWSVRRIRSGSGRRSILGALLIFASSIAVSYAAYTSFLGVSTFSPTPVDFFRGQGVDLFALVVPPRSLWVAQLTGIHHNLTAGQAYSDGHNLTDVYVGWALLTMAVAGLWLMRHRHTERPRHVYPVALAGLIGFVLALGPSLKVADFRSSQTLRLGIPTYNQYLMQSGEATVATGLAWIYLNVPGISAMRALYRWELLVRLALIVLALAALTRIANRGRTALAAAILAILVAESLPSLETVHMSGVRQASNITSFDRDVIDPLRGVIRSNERVILVNPMAGGSGSNHYLANWICPQLRLRCFNTGGDKGAALASTTYSKSVRAVLRSPSGLNQNINDLFMTNQVDAIVFVYFDLRANAYFWPPATQARTDAQLAGSKVVTGRPWSVSQQAWTAVVRPA